MGEDGQLFAQVRSELANTFICYDEPPSLRVRSIGRCLGVLYLLFFDGGSRGNPGSGGAEAIIGRLHASTHAACVLWVSSVAYGPANTSSNTDEYWGSFTVFGTQRQTTTHPCMSLRTVRLCLRNSGHGTLLASSTWCGYSLKQAPSLTISMSPAGDIIIAPTTKWRMDWRMSLWTRELRFKRTLRVTQIWSRWSRAS